MTDIEEKDCVQVTNTEMVLDDILGDDIIGETSGKKKCTSFFSLLRVLKVYRAVVWRVFLLICVSITFFTVS